jgi:hypothetical protein
MRDSEKPKPRPEDLLDWLGVRNMPDWAVARPYGHFLGFLLSALLITLPVLILGALGAAFAVIIDTIRNVLHSTGVGPNLGAGALIGVILGGPFVIWATVLKHKTLDYQKDSAITDRISKAVEQLGADKEVSRPMRNVTYTLAGDSYSVFEGRNEPVEVPSGATEMRRSKWNIVQRTVPNIEVRIGAILSLERIAQDSTEHDKGRDHVRVMEILCAYVRENAPASGAKDHPLGEWIYLSSQADKWDRRAHQLRVADRFTLWPPHGVHKSWGAAFQGREKTSP